MAQRTRIRGESEQAAANLGTWRVAPVVTLAAFKRNSDHQLTTQAAFALHDRLPYTKRP